ncbi:MAG: 50S ribosomal protein L29 [Anaerolineae bacterium]|nr:50S ribosomal protein L29 [Anaerolineae bacterium]
MQAREIRQFTKEEIATRLDEAYRELFNLRQDWYLGRLQDHNRLTAVRRDIARMKTIMRERELIEKMEGGAQ